MKYTGHAGRALPERGLRLFGPPRVVAQQYHQPHFLSVCLVFLSLPDSDARRRRLGRRVCDVRYERMSFDMCLYVPSNHVLSNTILFIAVLTRTQRHR